MSQDKLPRNIHASFGFQDKEAKLESQQKVQCLLGMQCTAQQPQSARSWQPTTPEASPAFQRTAAAAKHAGQPLASKTRGCSCAKDVFGLGTSRSLRAFYSACAVEFDAQHIREEARLGGQISDAAFA